MCRKVVCKTCKKATWAGCGRHVEQTLAGVPKSQRCTCNEHPSASFPPTKGIFSRLLGR